MTIIKREGLALLKVIHMANINGWERVVFESDSQLLVDSICANRMSLRVWLYNFKY
jgi:hypothetical protein